MRHLVPVALILVLAGCGESPPANVAANTTVPAIKPSPKLGSFDLGQPIRAFGTEPYWTLDVAPGDLEYTDYSVEAPKAEPFFATSPKLAGKTATYTTKNEEGAVVVLTLTLADCLEAGEEEDTVPLTAELKIGAKTLHGCAGPKPKEPPAGNASTGNAANASAD